MIKLGTVNDFKDKGNELIKAGYSIKIEANDLIMKLLIDVIDETLESTDANFIPILTCARLNAKMWTFNYNNSFWIDSALASLATNK